MASALEMQEAEYTIDRLNARLSALEAQLAEAKGKLNEIACWSQSQGLLWWQVKAREALSALEATPPAQACETCNGTGNEARHSICRDCEEATAPKVTADDVARRIFNDAHTGMRNCYDWDTPGLEDEHPGTIDRYRGYARSAIAALTAAQEEGR